MTPSPIALAGFHSAVLDYRAHRTDLKALLTTLRASQGLILVDGTSALDARPLLTMAACLACLVLFSTEPLAYRYAAAHPSHHPWLTDLWWLVAGMPRHWGMDINPEGPRVRIEASAWHALRMDIH